MNYTAKTLVGTALLALLITPACSTSTRIGQLIPKHPKSELVKGEVALAGYAQVTRFEETKEAAGGNQERAATAAAASAAAAFLAGLAIDAVKKELDREAEKYEKQYTARTALTVEDLGAEGYLIYARCTDGTAAQKSVRTAQIQEIARQISDHPDTVTSRLEKMIPAGKIPQSVLAIYLDAQNNTSIYKISKPRLWVAGVGAKVVGFNAAPWTYLGALLLKTGNQAEVDIAMSVKALQMKDLAGENKTWEGNWMQVEPSSTIVKGVKVKLGRPAVYHAGSTTGTWLPVPSVKKDGKPLGFVEVTFSITEKDPSNVKQHIKEASESIEKNKESWLQKIKDQF